MNSNLNFEFEPVSYRTKPKPVRTGLTGSQTGPVTDGLVNPASVAATRHRSRVRTNGLFSSHADRTCDDDTISKEQKGRSTEADPSSLVLPHAPSLPLYLPSPSPSPKSPVPILVCFLRPPFSPGQPPVVSPPLHNSPSQSAAPLAETLTLADEGAEGRWRRRSAATRWAWRSASSTIEDREIWKKKSTAFLDGLVLTRHALDSSRHRAMAPRLLASSRAAAPCSADPPRASTARRLTRSTTTTRAR